MGSNLRMQVLHSVVPTAELSHALQGTIVGLMSETADAADPSVGAHDTSPAQCLGLGLVRTVDADRGLLYLLTPLPIEQLQRVTTLQVPSNVCRSAFGVLALCLNLAGIKCLL